MTIKKKLDAARMPGKDRQDIMILATRIIAEDPLQAMITMHLSVALMMAKDGDHACPTCLADMVADAFAVAVEAGIMPAHGLPTDEKGVYGLPQRILAAWEVQEKIDEARELVRAVVSTAKH